MALWRGPSSTVLLVVVQAAHTPPHDAGLIAPFPGASAMESLVFPTDQPLRESVFAGVGGKADGSRFGRAFGRPSPHHFRGVKVYHGLVFFAGNEYIVVSKLGIEGMLLILQGGANPNVGGHTEFHLLGHFGGFNGDNPKGRSAVFYHSLPSFPINNTTIKGVKAIHQR